MEQTELTIIRVALDPKTGMVALGMEGIPIALAQMMIFEASEQLRILRARAAQMAFVAEQRELATVQSILGNNRPRG